VKRRRASALLLLAWTFLFAPGARAEGAACPPSGRSPWVRLVLEGPYFGESLRASVLQQLTADLERRGLAVCMRAAAEEPVAEMRIRLPGPAWLSIELRDEVSGERLAREVSLAAVPSDALGLSIATTAEELLHASWAQNAVTRPSGVSTAPSAVAPTLPPSSQPAPSQIPPSPRSMADASSSAPRSTEERPASAEAHTDSQSSSQRAAAVATQVYLLGEGEIATEGEGAFGGDLGVTWGGRATLGVRAGFRVAPEISSPHGTVEMREGILTLTGAVALVPRSTACGGELIIHGDSRYVEFDAVASPAARALGGSATAVVVSGGLGGWVRIARSWSIVGEATGGSPIRAVTASDSTTVVTGIRGLVIGFALGVATPL
jgi:hypothetical protein